MGSCCIAQGTQLDALWWPRGVGRGERIKEEAIYIIIADSLYYMSETHNIVKQLCCAVLCLVVPDSPWPPGRQPTRLPCPWDSPGKNTGAGCHFLLQCIKVKSESEVSHVRLLTTPCTAAYQAPLSMGFSRQEYWSGVPLWPQISPSTFGKSSSS